MLIYFDMDYHELPATVKSWFTSTRTTVYYQPYPIIYPYFTITAGPVLGGLVHCFGVTWVTWAVSERIKVLQSTYLSKAHILLWRCVVKCSHPLFPPSTNSKPLFTSHVVPLFPIQEAEISGLTISTARVRNPLWKHVRMPAGESTTAATART